VSLALATWLVLPAVLCASATAHARLASYEPGDENTDGAPQEATVERVWYGAPMLVTDLVALTLFTGGALLADHHLELGKTLAFAGVGAYLVGGPIVHVHAGRVGVGFGSLGMRAGSPMVGFWTGFFTGALAANGCSGDGCQLGYGVVGGIVGFLAGAATAAIIDNAVLARKPVVTRRTALAVVPLFRPGPSGTGGKQGSLVLQGRW
jgi:hypothetical protein